MQKHFYKKLFLLLFSLLSLLTRLDAQKNTRGPGADLGFVNPTVYSTAATQYVNLGKNLNTLLSASDFTVEFWMNASAHSQYASLISNKDYNSGTTNGFIIFQSGASPNTLGLNFNTSGGTRTDLTFTVNNEIGSWNHIAVVFKRTGASPSISCYVNGVLRTSGTLSTSTATNTITPTNTNVNWLAGSSYDANASYQRNQYGYSGQIDEIKIWNTVRTQTQILTNMCQKMTGSEANLAAYYPLNEGTGTTVTNSSSGTSISSYTASNYNGTLTGPPTWQNSGAPIGDASAYLYPGASAANWSGITVPSSSALSITNASGSARGTFQISSLTATTYPVGAVVYYTKNYPLYRVGASGIYDTTVNTNNDAYPSVFFSDGAGLRYTATYDYSGYTTGVPSSGANLFYRDNATDAGWIPTYATQNTSSKTFTYSSNVSRADFIPGGGINTPISSVRGASNCLIYTNPTSNTTAASQYVNLGRNLNTILDASDFTVEFWMNASAHYQYASLISNKDYNNGANTGFVIAQSSSNSILVNFNTSTGTRVDLNAIPVPNEIGTWNHIAAVFKRNGSSPTITVYINGVQKAIASLNSSTSTASITPSSTAITWNIGAAYDNFYGKNIYGYSGQLDEVKIWNVAKSQGEIRTSMCQKLSGSESNLAAYYTINEGTGTSVGNSSLGTSISTYTASNYTGTIVGSPTWQVSGAPLGDVSAYIFPGSVSGNWTGRSISTGSMLDKTSNVRGSLTLSSLSATTYPDGVFVYYNRNYPNYRLSATGNPFDTTSNTNNNVYPSVFFSGGSVLSYTLLYDYSTFTSAIPSAGGAMYNRSDNTQSNWYDLLATQNTTNKTFTVTSSATRNDFILGGQIKTYKPWTKGAGQMLTLGAANSQKISDYVNLGSTLNTTLATSNFTVEFWINTLSNDLGDAPIIGNKDWSSGANTGFVISQNKSASILKYNFKTASGSRVDLSFNFPTSVPGWHHVAVVFDRSNSYGLTNASGIVFVDGVQVASQSLGASATTSISASLPWVIGEDGKFAYQTTYGYKVNANIDEVRIWASSRTQAQIRANMCQKLSGSESLLAAYYKFDELSGRTLTNSSIGTSITSYTASAYNGTLVNGVVRSLATTPLGDVSGINFPATADATGWSSQTATTGTMINASSSNRGNLTLKNMNIGSGGTYPNGALVFYSKGYPYTRVSGANNLDTSTNTNNDVYSGLFISGGTNYNYALDYDLSTFSSAYKYINSAGIYGKQNENVTLWNDLGAIPDSVNKTLRLTNVSYGSYDFIPGNSNTSGSALNTGSGKAIQLGIGQTSKVSDYVSLGSNYNSSLATSDFTVEYWVNTLTYDGKTSSHISNQDFSAPTSNTGFSITQKNSTTCTANFKTSGGTSVNLDFTFPNSVAGWHHIAVVADRNTNQTLTVYVDGLQSATTSLSSATPTNSINSSLSWNLGEDGTGTYQAGTSGGKFNGQFDEVKIWSSVRTLTNIRDNMCQKLVGNESYLLGYIKFDNGSGVNATNYSLGTSISSYTASNFAGTLTNAPSWVISGAPVGDASAYNFPASWSGTSISTGAMTNASSSVRGTFNIQNMTSSSTLPDGAFVYYVKGFPNTRVNANNIDTTKNASNDVYTGVFVSGGSGYSYDAVYNLSTYPSSVTSISNGTLFGRQNATITSWTNKSAIPNSSSSTLKLSGLTNTYQEFIPGDGGYNYTTNNKGAGNNLSFGTSTANYNSDYASLGTALNSTLATSDFTLEFWVNTASYDGKDAPYISNKNWHSGANVGLAIAQNSSNTTSKINFTTSGGSRVDLNFTYPNNTPGWHHIAVLADRNSAKTLTIYVDGVQAATTSIATNSPTNSLNSGLPWNIGEDGTGAYQKNESTHPKFNGNIDEVRVWNTLRTVSQIRQYMCQKITGFESNLAAYYKLDNTTGNYFNNNSYGIGLTNYDKSSFNGSLINTNSTTSPLPNWALSGAAIGDTNVVTYASSWSGLSLVNNLLSSSNSGRGTVTVSNISTSLGTVPSGMHLYSVKGYPKTRISSVGTYFDSGANINNDYYFGVFSAGGSNFSYDLVHDYSNYPSAITVNSIAGLAGKTDQTVSAWDDLAATADTINKKLILSAFNTGKLEFIPGNTANGSYPKASFFDKTSFTHKAQFNKTSAFNFGTSTNFTVEFWLKVPTDISTFDTWNAFVGDKDWTSGGNAGWVIFMHKYRSASNTATLEFNLGDGSNRSDSYSGSDVVNRTVNKINDNQWHHVAMTINRTGYGKLYVDGVLRSVRTVSNVGNLNTSYPVLIGVDALGNYANHKFQLDEFKMWNVERSQDSIIAYMEKEISNPLYYSNLLVYYKMDGTNVSLKDAKNNIPLTYTASINRSFNVPITKWATYNGSTWSGATTSPDSTTNALILGSKTLSGKEYYRNIVIGTGGSISGSTSDTVVVTGTNFNVSGGSVSLSNSTIQYKNGNNTPALPWGNFTIGSMEFNNSNGTLPFHNLTVNKTLKLSSGIVDLSGNAPIMANGSTIEFAGGKFNNTVPTVSSVGNTFNLKYCFTTDSNFALTNAFNFINDTTKIGDITINHTGPNRNTITNSYKTVARGKIKIISGTLYQDADLFAKDSIIIRANSRINTQTGSVTDTLWLQNGSYLAESTTGYVKGIVKSKNNLVSFGNDVDMKGVLKLKWNGSTNPGNITIERRHGTSLFGSPKLSHLGRIYNPSNMKWIIKPTYNGNLATQITFPYKTGELNGVGESNLQVFRKPENGIVYNFFKSLTYNYTAKTIQTKPTDSFSEWILGGSNNPLPVELINFSATKVKGYDVALLNWSTAQEDNNDRFEIERLFDNGQWTKVGSIKGIGFSNTVNNYSFNDSFFATTSKSVYYRLKQIDYNGQLEYSPVRKISLTTDFETDIKAWFNKQMGDIQVSINTSSADDKLIITLMDAFGKIVLTENASTIKGLNNIQINAQNIAKGFYLMNISGNSINYSTRLIKY